MKKTIAERVQDLAAEVKKEAETIVRHIEATDQSLTGVKPLARNAAVVSSSQMLVHGWSAQKYLVQHQLEDVRRWLSSGMAGDVTRLRELQQFGDNLLQHPTLQGVDLNSPQLNPGRLAFHPEFVMRLQPHVKAWLDLHDQLQGLSAQANV